LGDAVEVMTLNVSSLPSVVDRSTEMKASDPNSFSDRSEKSTEEAASDSKNKCNKNKKSFTVKVSSIICDPHLLILIGQIGI